MEEDSVIVLNDIFFSSQPHHHQPRERNRGAKQTECYLQNPEQPSYTNQAVNTRRPQKQPDKITVTNALPETNPNHASQPNIMKPKNQDINTTKPIPCHPHRTKKHHHQIPRYHVKANNTKSLRISRSTPDSQFPTPQPKSEN